MTTKKPSRNHPHDLRITLNDRQMTLIRSIAERKNISLLEAARLVIDRASKQSPDDFLTPDQQILSESLSTTLEPHVERLAKINAKNARASHITLLLIVELLKNTFPHLNISELLEQAKKTAARELKKTSETEGVN